MLGCVYIGGGFGVRKRKSEMIYRISKDKRYIDIDIDD